MITPPRTPEVSSGRAQAGRLVLCAGIFSVFTNLLILSGPLFMLQVYDRVLDSRSGETLFALFALVTLLYISFGVLDAARHQVMARVGARLYLSLREPVFRAMLDRAAGTVPDRPSMPLRDLETVRDIFSSPLLLAAFDLPWTLLFSLLIFAFDPLLGWLALAGSAILVLAAILNQVLTSRAMAKANGISLAARIQAEEAARDPGFVLAQGMAPALRLRWTRQQDLVMGALIRAGDRGMALSSFSRTFRLFLQSAMLAAGALLVLGGELTAGAMIAASILLSRALAPIETLIGHWAVAQRAWAAWSGLRQLPCDRHETATETDLPAPEARLTVRGATVTPIGRSRPILRNVSFDLQPGEALGIIGRSGSGKTTLARIVVGSQSLASGEVRLSGATPGQYGPDRLGRHIGYLPQTISLFDGTIAENIARMEPDPDTDRVIAAARLAGVHDTILGLPDGYDTTVGSAMLSGGQAQRVALARALYRDPVLLVLDEPNSALDAEGTGALNAVIAQMKSRGGAVLLVTQRPTAIAACDRLLVLDAGAVTACGPRDDIIRTMMRNSDHVRRAAGGGR